MNLFDTHQRKRFLGIALTVLLVSVCYWQFTTPRPTPPRPRPPGWVATSGAFNHVFLKGRWLVWDAYPFTPTTEVPYNIDLQNPQLGAYDLQAQRLIMLPNASGSVLALLGDDLLIERSVPTSTLPSGGQYLRLNLITLTEQPITDEAKWRRLTGQEWEVWTEPYPVGCPRSTDCRDIYACGKEIWAKNLLTGETHSLGILGSGGRASLNSMPFVLLGNRGTSCDVKSFGSGLSFIDLEALEYRVLSYGGYLGPGPDLAARNERLLAYSLENKYMRVVRVLPHESIQVLFAGRGYAQGLIGENILLYTPDRWPGEGLVAFDWQTGDIQTLSTTGGVQVAGGDTDHVFWTGYSRPQDLFVAPLHLQPPASTSSANGTPVPTFPPEFLEPRPLPVWLTATPWRTMPTPAP